MAFEQGVENKATASEKFVLLGSILVWPTSWASAELSANGTRLMLCKSVAKALLLENLGNSYKTFTAYTNKALSWQTIRTEDAKSLQSYVLFLWGYCNIMEELEYVQELDLPVYMRSILARLPYKLRERWRSKAHDTIENTGWRAGFSDLMEFIHVYCKYPIWSVFQRVARFQLQHNICSSSQDGI